MDDDLLSDEDKALFREHMRSVKPLHEQTKQSATPPTREKKIGTVDNCSATRTTTTCRGLSAASIDPANTPRDVAFEMNCQQPLISPEKEEQKTYYLSDTLIDTVFSETVLSYAQPSLSKQRFNALKEGHISWETRLDLHGLTSEKSRISLCHFIQSQIQNHKRCLLIIHGKGGHQGAPPTIKNLLNRWLPQIEEVLAFHSALPKDGGNGAVYVLLKKKFK